MVYIYIWMVEFVWLLEREKLSKGIYLFCFFSLVRSFKSFGFNCDGEDGERFGVDSVVDEDVVCNEVDGFVIWLVIWLIVCDIVFFIYERVEFSFFVILFVVI